MCYNNSTCEKGLFFCAFSVPVKNVEKTGDDTGRQYFKEVPNHACKSDAPVFRVQAEKL